MRTLKKEYQAPEITNQGSAITKTAATFDGSCEDGGTVGKDTCKCAGTGHDCKAEEEL